MLMWSNANTCLLLGRSERWRRSQSVLHHLWCSCSWSSKGSRLDSLEKPHDRWELWSLPRTLVNRRHQTFFQHLKTVSYESGDRKLFLIVVKMQIIHLQKCTFTRSLMWEKMNSEQTQIPNIFCYSHSVSRSFDAATGLPGSYWWWRRLRNLCQWLQCPGIDLWWHYMGQWRGPGPQSHRPSTAELQHFGSDLTTSAGKCTQIQKLLSNGTLF